MNPRSVLLVLLAIAVLGAAVWFAFQDRPAADVPTGTPQRRVLTPPAGPATLPASRPTPSSLAIVKTPSDPGRYFLLPDGTFAPALNNIYGAPAMEWPRQIPWSPIIGTERDQGGLEWYVHGDGSKSTTILVWRSDLGRGAPVTYVANPTQPLPLLPGELQMPGKSGVGSSPAR